MWVRTVLRVSVLYPFTYICSVRDHNDEAHKTEDPKKKAFVWGAFEVYCIQNYINCLRIFTDVYFRAFCMIHVMFLQLLLQCNYADGQLLKFSKISILCQIIRPKLF